MKKCFFIIDFLFVLITLAHGQSDTIQLKEITVQSSPYKQAFSQSVRPVQIYDDTLLNSLPATSIDMVLEQLSGIDFRQRGVFGMQADINIRGGSFDQALILINGIPANDPQSGHLNLDVALATDQIQQIEVIDGPAARWFGTNALSGGINIITNQKRQKSLQFDLSGGQYGLLQSQVNTHYRTGPFWQNTNLQFARSDGYQRDTDFKDKAISHQLHYRKNKTVADMQFSYRDKAFGAHNFYTSKYPDQFEQTRTFFNSFHFETGEKRRIQVNISWRRHYDRFELFRQGKGWYELTNGWYVMQDDSAGYHTPTGFYPYTGPNFHRTDVVRLGTSLEFRSKWGKTAIRVNDRYEKIVSNVLGEILDDTLFSKIDQPGYYNHQKSRNNLNFFINHLYNLHNFSLSLGVHSFYNPDYGFSLNPGVDLSYFINPKLKTFFSANRSNRLPTFTDLYYQGPTHISNPDLKPENTTETETGIKFNTKSMGLSASVFYRESHNLIDWVRLSPEDKWESKNLTQLYTYGLSFHFFYRNIKHPKNPIKRIQLNYTYLNSSKTSGDFLSLYALDFMKHQLGFFVQQRLTNRWSAGWSLLYQRRNGSYFDAEANKGLAYQSVYLLNAQIQYQWPSWQYYLQATNILNQTYHDIGSVTMPGIWISTGLRCRINFAGSRHKKN